MTPVSKLLALEIENLQLKLEQLDRQGKQWADEQRSLIEQARTEVGAGPGTLYNTSTRTFQAASGPVPLSTPAPRQAKRAGDR